MTDICSIWAYQEIKESGQLGDRQAMFLSCIIDANAYHHSPSAREIGNLVIAKFGIGFSRNGLGSRLSELERLGYIKKDGIKIDNQTLKKVNGWKYTGRKESKLKNPVAVACKCCKGTGVVIRNVFLD